MGRYISIFLIVFIGVGFYAGIQSTSPDIRATANKFYKEYNLMDFKIVSSMGLTDDDVNSVSRLDGVDNAVGSYSSDVLDGDKTIRIHSLEDSINNVKLTSGRMPQSETECVADKENYKIGDTIQIEGDTDDLKNTEFTVSGLVESALYLTYDYGTTTVGDGKLSSFVFINKDNFEMDVYTEIYIAMTDSKSEEAYRKGYETLADDLNNELVAIKTEREDARADEVYDEGSNKIKKNEKKLNKEKQDGEKQLLEAKRELDESARKIEDAKIKLKKNEVKLNNSVKKQNAEFDEGNKEIKSGWSKINSTLKNNGIEKKQLPGTIKQLKNSISGLKNQLNNLTPGSPEYTTVQKQITSLTDQYDGLVTLQSSIDKLTSEEAKLNTGIKTFNKKIKDSKEQLESGKVEILENEAKIQDGYDEYNENLKEFESEISKAEKKIADAKEDLNDLEQPKWTVFGREAAVGYSALETDAGVVADIANVFPLFFILIVVLMTSNTMTRMIDEERSEIGTFTSLGYSDAKIIKPYLLYVLSASGLGAIAGFFVGCYLLPVLIFQNFEHILPKLLILYDPVMFAVSILVTFGIMAAVTIWGCHRKLRYVPAKLLRPKPPRKGHTILLQRIGIIWNHLSFTWKVTMRNMFRFKKRALMTIIGIAGCAALMLVGFGLRDSMDGIVDKQYGEIFHYDNMITLKDDVDGRNDDSFGEINKLFNEENVDAPLLLNQTAVTHDDDDMSLDIYVIVPEDTGTVFSNYFSLKDEATGETLKIDKDGAVISQKIADSFDLNKGDIIEVTDADNNIYEIKISDVAENYISNYIYMNNSMYEEVFEKDLKYNTVVTSYDGDEEELARVLMNNDNIVNITFTSDIIQEVMDGNAQLDSIVILIIIIACMLSFIVLYNLTAINISERTREIATLKVLGFREYETNAYIYRETAVLTVLSIAIGLVFGVFLHGYIIDVIEGTTRTLSRIIHMRSYIFSGVLTLIFSLIMQIFTYFKLKTVDMIQSLKSVE